MTLLQTEVTADDDEVVIVELEELDDQVELVSLSIPAYPGFELLVKPDWFTLADTQHVLYLFPTNRRVPGISMGYYLVNYVPEILSETDLAAACFSAAYDIGFLNGDTAPEDAPRIVFVSVERFEVTCEMCDSLITSTLETQRTAMWDHAIKVHRKLLEQRSPDGLTFNTNRYHHAIGD